MENNYIRLSEKLKELVKEIQAKNTPPLIGQIINYTGGKSFGILLLIFSILSAIPLPIPGYNTLCGIGITLLLLQMLYGKETPWLPEKINNFVLPIEGTIKGLNHSINMLKTIEHLIYPRLTIICDNRVLYTLLLVLGILTMVPIPFVTAIPAIALIICAVGLVEGDGFICLISALLGFLIIIAYVGVLYFILSYGFESLISLVKNVYDHNPTSN